MHQLTQEYTVATEYEAQQFSLGNNIPEWVQARINHCDGLPWEGPPPPAGTWSMPKFVCCFDAWTYVQ